MNASKNKAIRGFTLLEVLIALLVLSVGLLGLASLQTRGLAAGHNAYLRSQAVLLARDMAERIRANNNLVLSTESSESNAYSTEFAREPGTSDCVNADCNPAQLANFDVDQWLQSLATILPSGDGRIRKTGSSYEIRVDWDADRNGELKRYVLNLELAS